jgi:beta-N-acetylhexosaminidase
VIGLDQENGGVNSLFDEIYIRQYPSAMGIAATGSKELAFEVAKATAEEISACGVNLVMGPCLDVLTNARNQPLGVRTAGDDPQQVSDFGIASMKGYQAAGVATMGKHFPSYGNLEFIGSMLDVPTIPDSLQQLSLSALVPFKNAINQGLDAMMVGGCAMSSKGLEVMHACLSDRVVDGLLRHELKFDGVVISECLEMDALSHNIGVGGGTVMAVNAGCDLVLLCRSYSVQLEAMAGLKAGIESGVVDMSRVWNALRRVLALKSNWSWEKALNPAGISLLSTLQPSHTALSTRAYNGSITVVRDRNSYLPLPNLIDPGEELLLLTPLVKPLAASAAARAVIESLSVDSPEPAVWEHSASVISGEQVFRELGRGLARRRHGRVLHTSYTANGVRPQHEQLINRASAIVLLTADANRNLYQTSFAKHVALLLASDAAGTGACSGTTRKEKPLIVVATSSPIDLLDASSIGTYIATYDFTVRNFHSGKALTRPRKPP